MQVLAMTEIDFLSSFKNLVVLETERLWHSAPNPKIAQAAKR
jgi:hypothetical protein